MTLRGRSFAAAALLSTTAVLATRLPFRSDFLFSWDSANYAFAIDHIDIAAHRPHPPGYLGYVLAARALEWIAGDANEALVFWNVLATAAAIVLVLRFAWELAGEEARRMPLVWSAGAVMIASPMLWVYGEVAEIYVSEVLVTMLVAYTAWRVLSGHSEALYWCGASLLLAAFFKLTAAILMLPLAVHAWRSAPIRNRWRAGALLIAGASIASVLALAAQPELPGVIWRHFLSSTAGSRLNTIAIADIFERLNHNGRDTLLALVQMLGVVNVAALAGWVLFSRRLPERLTRAAVTWWSLPWLAVCLLVHIGKPGYVLPLLPVASLLLAGFYARWRPGARVAVVALQSVLNVAHFTLLPAELPASVTGGTLPYREKSVVQRAASDLQPLTFPTRATIARSDEHVRRLLATVTRVCPSGTAVIVASAEPVDMRRVMWYFPGATVVHIVDERVLNIGERGSLSPVGDDARSIATPCPALWLAPDAAAPPTVLQARVARVPGVGFVIENAVVEVNRKAVTVRQR
jgi:hypothetical protein